MLTENGLLTLLTPFADQASTDFVAFPATGEAAAAAWAAAARQWAGAVTPVTVTQAAAESAFGAQMLTCTVGGDPLGLPRAWAALAGALAAGMAGFVAVPPPGLPDYTPVYAIGLGGGNGDCLHLLATITLAWLRGGTATPVSSGPPINWT